MTINKKLLKIFSVIIYISVMFISVILFEKNFNFNADKNADYHANTLSTYVWNMDDVETKNMAELIFNTNIYYSLKVYAMPFKLIIVEFENTSFSNFEETLYNFNLIRGKKIEKNIIRDNNIIGVLALEVLNKNIYIYFYISLILIMIIFLVYTFIKIKFQDIKLSNSNKMLVEQVELTKKAEDEIKIINKYLEKRVEERTMELNKSNEDLKNEINQKILVQEELKDNNETLGAFNEELTAMNEELESLYQIQSIMNNKFEKIIFLSSKLMDYAFKNDEKFLSKILESSLTLIPEADSGTIALIEDKYVRFVENKSYIKTELEKLSIEKSEFDFHSSNKVINGNLFVKSFCLTEKNKEIFDILKKIFENVEYSMAIYLETPQGQLLGVISLDITKEKMMFSKESQKISEAFGSLASSFLTISKFVMLEEKISKTALFSMIKLLEIYDLYTQGHSERVALYATKIGIAMNLNTDELSELYWSGIVHDIGKILVSKDVLNKKGKLTDEEYDEIKKHPEWGYTVLNDSDLMKDIAINILYHHERWDGKGYPKGLEKDQIPFFSRILSLADAYDAMTSNRSYRSKMSTENALKEISKNSGTQFDPNIAEVFLKIIEKN